MIHTRATNSSLLHVEVEHANDCSSLKDDIGDMPLDIQQCFGTRASYNSHDWMLLNSKTETTRQ